MNQNEFLAELHQLGVPSDLSKTISEPMVHLAQTVHLSSIDTNTISKWDENEISDDPRHRGVPSGACKRIFEPMVLSSQTMHLLVSRLALSPNRPKWPPTCATSPMSTIGCVQNDFWAYGTFRANVHLSCTDTNTISKHKTRFQMTHVT
jgi:hypothetical protein